MKTMSIASRVPVLLLTMSAQGVAGWASFFLSPASIEIATTLSLPFSWIGWQVGMVYGATLFGCLFSGRVIALIGASRSLQLAMLLTIFGALLATSFSGSSLGVFWLFLGSIFIGLGYSFTNPASSELLILFSGKGGGLIFSLKQSSVPLGLVVAGLTTPLCTQHWGWQSSSLPVVIAALLSIAFLEHTRTRFSQTLADKQRREQLASRPSAILSKGFARGIFVGISPLRGIFRLCKTPHLFWLAMASVSLSPIQMTVMGYTSPFAVDYLGYGLLVGGFLLSLSQCATFIARPLWGVMSDRYFESRRMIGLLAIAGGFLSLSLLLLPRGANFLVTAILFSLLAACVVGWNGLFMMSLAVLSRERRAVGGSFARGKVSANGMSVSEATSSALFFTYGACFIGPVMVPTIIDWTDGNYAFVFALYGVLGMISAIYCLRRSLRSSFG